MKKKTYLYLILVSVIVSVMLFSSIYMNANTDDDGLVPANNADSIWNVTSDDWSSQCYATVHSWEELELALSTVPEGITNMDQSELIIDVIGFQWPESTDGEIIDLVIDYPGRSGRPDGSSMPHICLMGIDRTAGVDVVEWEIPEHINLTCYENLEFYYYTDIIKIILNGSLNFAGKFVNYYQGYEIIVNGTLKCMSNADLNMLYTITVNDGGTLITERCRMSKDICLKEGSSMKIGQSTSVYDLTINNGSVFEPASYSSWSLFGTVTLCDGVEIQSGTVEITTSSANDAGDVNAAIVTDGEAIFNATISLKSAWSRTASITLQGENLTVGPITVATNTGDDSGYAEIVIPAGSYVKAQYINCNIYNYNSNLDMKVIGTLEFSENGGSNSWRLGTLTLGDETNRGTIIMSPRSSLLGNYKDTENPVTGKITGDGTVKMYAKLVVDEDDVRWGDCPFVFGVYRISETEISELRELGFIEGDIDFWSNWTDDSCDHKWGEAVVTKEPRENKEGSKCSVCENCGTVKEETIPATGLHSGGTATCATLAICVDCGEPYGEYADHTYNMDAWNSGNSEGHWHDCIYCDAHTDPEAHVPGPEATEEAPQICTVCDYIIKDIRYTLGDISDDGKIDLDDVVTLLRHVSKANVITDPRIISACDIDGNGAVNLDDVVRLLRYVSKAIPSLR